MENQTLECGCNLSDGKIDYYAICHQLNYGNYCKGALEILKRGLTHGVFQLEKYLGKVWSKRMQPRAFDDVAALIALLRPGCLKAVSDGKSMTQRYVDRHNGVEEIKSVHPALDDILQRTYGVLCYQEQSIQIAMRIAGFDEGKADELRKSIGKKDVELMRKLKGDFISGAEKTGIVSKEDAEKIFSWIEEGQRYSFNASHSFSYGAVTYLTAWVKYHFPVEFYAAWLKWAKYKANPLEETANLIREARILGISINPPRLELIHESGDDIYISGNSIYLPLSSLKNVGQSATKKVKLVTNCSGVGLMDLKWPQLMLVVLSQLNSATVSSLILGGCCDYYGSSRKRMLYEYDLVMKLTKRELEHVTKNWKNFQTTLEILKEARNISNRRRAETIDQFIDALKNPPYSLKDDISWLFREEKALYGTPITVTLSALGGDDVTQCVDIKLLRKNDRFRICGLIHSVKKWKAKSGKSKGKWMVAFELEDETGSSPRCLVMPEYFNKYEPLLYEGNVVKCLCTKGKTDSIFVDKVEQV